VTTLRLRIAYDDRAELRRALDDEIARGVLLVRVTPPESLAFRDVVSLEITTRAGLLAIETEVVSILAGVGVVVAVLPEHHAAARALEASLESGDAAIHEIVSDDAATDAPRAPMGSALAEKIRLARHGTREDRNALLREPNRMLHALVIKCPQVTVDEVAAWAKNAQMGADFLRQIADRKDWLSRPNIALGLARNPKTPGDIAVRALDHVGDDALRQMIKGAGVPPHVAAAARKKAMRK
jgi:hypothetical protein